MTNLNGPGWASAAAAGPWARGPWPAPVAQTELSHGGPGSHKPQLTDQVRLRVRLMLNVMVAIMIAAAGSGPGPGLRVGLAGGTQAGGSSA